MRHVNRWDPLNLARSERLTYPLFRPSDSLQTGHWQPALDLTETPEAYRVSLELPGLVPEAIDVNFEHGTLEIRGERQAETATTEGAWHRVERRYGAFSRAVRIDAPVDAERIAASYVDGVLEIVVPKAVEARRQQIPVAS